MLCVVDLKNISGYQYDKLLQFYGENEIEFSRVDNAIPKNVSTDIETKISYRDDVFKYVKALKSGRNFYFADVMNHLGKNVPANKYSSIYDALMFMVKNGNLKCLRAIDSRDGKFKNKYTKI